MTGITIGISPKSQGQGKGKPSPISAVLLPAIQTTHDGQALIDTLDPTVMQISNYTSREGAISTVIAEWSVDGSAWTTLGTTTVIYDQSVQARIIVRDEQGNERVFLTGETRVAGIVPTLEASGSLQGRNLTISVDSLSGTPLPTTELTSLTLDSVDVLGDATGVGPWSYAVPDSASLQTVAWAVTATNTEGADVASGSLEVSANQFAPVASGDLTDLVLTVGEEMSPVDVSAGFDLGVPTATIALHSGTLPGGLSFDGTTMSGTPTTASSAVTLVFRATNLVGSADRALQVTVAEAASIVVTPPVLAALTHGDTLSAAVTWGAATAPEGETMNAPLHEMSLDGGVSWGSYDGNHVTAMGETIVVRETWSTLEGTGPAYGNSAAQSVAGIAPAILTAPSLSDRRPGPGETVTITEATYSGTPAPQISGTLTLNGVDVAGDMTALTYTIPSDTAEGAVLEWSEMAGNGIAPDASQTINAIVMTAALPSEIVVMGASLVYDAFGNAYDADTQTWGSANGAATTALQTEAGLYSPIPVYGWGRPGARLGYRADFDIPSAADRIDIIRAQFPNALIVCHIGGGDVSGYKTQATMGPGEKNTWNADLGALIDKAAADGNVYIGTLTFRDYNPTNSCFYDPGLGSRPFNELDALDFKGIIPAIAARPELAHTLTSYGRPFTDYYRWMLTDFEDWLDPNTTDGTHPTDAGDLAMRDYTISVLAHILNRTEPAEIPERVASLNISDPGDGTLEITFDGGIDTTVDSITLSDAFADPYWEGTHTTYADGSPIDLSATDTLAAKCLVAPTPYLKTDADGSGTPSKGDTVALPDAGIWLQGDNNPTLVVTWHDAGGIIPGAEGLEYMLAEGQAGEDVYPVVTASVAGKTDESQICAPLNIGSGADPWAFSDSTVTNIPASEGWVFTGSVATTIPTGV